MSDRWGLGLLVAAVLCCAAPVLIGTGLGAAALGAVRQHWGWFAAGVGFVALAGFLRVWRTGAAPHCNDRRGSWTSRAVTGS